MTDNILVFDDWLTAEISDLQTVHRLGREMQATGQWTEVVGGMNSITVQFDPTMISPNEARTLFTRQLSKQSGMKDQKPSEIELPTCYDTDFGPDLEPVAEQLGIKPDEIAEWHGGLLFTVAMLGFMPGFAYLNTDCAVPEIGRLRQPRQSVAAGSIGIIGSQSCIYAFASPGGWPVIGRTAAKLFDAKKSNPATLSPGQLVRFIPVTRTVFEDLL